MTFTPAPPAEQPRNIDTGGHIYGLTRLEVPISIGDIVGANGRVRGADLRDIRKASTTSPMKVVKGNDTVEVVHAMESVTTVLGLLDKKGLKDWWNKLLIDTVSANPIKPNESKEDYYDRVQVLASQGKDASAGLGTKIHSGIEDCIAGRPIDAAIAVYVEKAIEILKELRVNIHIQEVIVYCQKFGIAGRLDLAGEIDGKPCVVDFKSRKQIASYRTDSIQIAAYGVAHFGLSRWSQDGIGINILLDTKTPGEGKAVVHDKEVLHRAWMAWCGIFNVYVHEKQFDPR